MIKLDVCAARVPNMTHAQYSRYARDNHARLLMEIEAVSRHIRCYIQHHVFDGAYGVLAAPWRYDSISHISTDSIEDQVAIQNTREYREIIAPDEPKFADARSVRFTPVQESPLTIKAAGGSPHRLLHYGKAKDGAAQALCEAWSRAHAELAAKSDPVLNSVRRAVINRALPGPQGAPAFDAMLELGFLERSCVPAMCDYVAMMEERLAPLLDREQSFFLLADAVPVRGTLS
jgi:hypothetical protein